MLKVEGRGCTILYYMTTLLYVYVNEYTITYKSVHKICSRGLWIVSYVIMRAFFSSLWEIYNVRRWVAKVFLDINVAPSRGPTSNTGLQCCGLRCVYLIDKVPMQPRCNALHCVCTVKLSKSGPPPKIYKNLYSSMKVALLSFNTDIQ